MVNPELSIQEHPTQAKEAITAIFVRGYKSLVNSHAVEIRPLTILAGANSSGKSSTLQPLLLLKQTLEATYDPGPLLINGPNVRFTSARQFLSNLSGRDVNGNITIGLKVGKDNQFLATFEKQPKKGIELIHTRTIADELEINLTPKMTQAEIWTVISTIFPQQTMDDNSGKVVRDRCFFEIRNEKPKVGGIVTTVTYSPGNYFQEFIHKIIHVPGLRGNPERTYKTTAVGATFPGTFENYVATIIDYWQPAKDHRLEELQKVLQALGLTQRVEARRVDDTQVELRVGRLPSNIEKNGKDMVNIADVGFGVSQTLPILVALLVAEPGQLVYLEQPEIHLHPKAQVALAKVLADAAKRGVRVVAETHSDLLLLGIQTLVAEGYIAPEEVILHWFNRRKNGATEITTAELDEAGAYGDWPEDFADVILGAQNRYIGAAEARLMPQ
jgi:predicted ATPase